MENQSYSLNNMSSMPGEFGNDTTSISIIDWVRSISWPIWFLIFVVLAFLGFNILTFISQGTADVGSWVNKVIYQIKNTGKFINTIKNAIFVSATGTKGIIDSTAKVSDEILEKVQTSTQVGNIAPNIPLVPSSSTSNSSITPTITSNNIPISSTDIAETNTLNRALNTATTKHLNNGSLNYEADDSLSNIQSGGSKSGWCYIGEDRGFRSCAQVSSSEECMSGDIFPSQEICVNPNLRQ
jgi:hypothetical protein